jgi:hypothetical protein
VPGPWQRPGEKVAQGAVETLRHDWRLGNFLDKNIFIKDRVFRLMCLLVVVLAIVPPLFLMVWHEFGFLSVCVKYLIMARRPTGNEINGRTNPRHPSYGA